MKKGKRRRLREYKERRAAKWTEAVIAGHLTGEQLKLWRKKMAKTL